MLLQILGAESAGPVAIEPNQRLRIPTGLQFPTSSNTPKPATPNFVNIESDCTFLTVLSKQTDGSFDIWNPSTEQALFRWKAHHVHSDEQEPLHQTPDTSAPSPLPPPRLCPLPGQQTPNPLAAHSRYSEDFDQPIPDEAPGYVPPLEFITCYLDDLLNPYISWDNGRFIINRNGRYQIIANANVQANLEGTVLAIVLLCVDPDGISIGPTSVLPCYNTARVDYAGPTSQQLNLETILEIDETLPEAERTFELWMLAAAEGATTGSENGVICADISIVRIADYTPTP